MHTYPLANGVREPAGNVQPFPAHRMMWARARNNQVAVTHLGRTVVYDSPEDLHAAVRAVRAEGERRRAVKTWGFAPRAARLQFIVVDLLAAALARLVRPKAVRS